VKRRTFAWRPSIEIFLWQLQIGFTLPENGVRYERWIGEAFCSDDCLHVVTAELLIENRTSQLLERGEWEVGSTICHETRIN